MSDLLESEYSACILIPDSQEESPVQTSDNIYSRLTQLKQVSPKPSLETVTTTTPSSTSRGQPNMSEEIAAPPDGDDGEILVLETTTPDSSDSRQPPRIAPSGAANPVISESSDSGGGISDAATAVVSDTEGHGQVIVPRQDVMDNVSSTSTRCELQAFEARCRGGATEYASSVTSHQDLAANVSSVSGSSSSDEKQKPGTSFTRKPSTVASPAKKSLLLNIAESQEDIFEGDADKERAQPPTCTPATKIGSLHVSPTVLAPETYQEDLHSDDDECIPPSQDSYVSIPRIVPSSPTLQSTSIEQEQPWMTSLVSGESSKSCSRRSSDDKERSKSREGKDEKVEVKNLTADGTMSLPTTAAAATQMPDNDNANGKDMAATQQGWSLRLTPTQTENDRFEKDTEDVIMLDETVEQEIIEIPSQTSNQASEPHFRLECPTVTSQGSLPSEQPSIFVKVKNSPKKDRKRAQQIPISSDSEDFFGDHSITRSPRKRLQMKSKGSSQERGGGDGTDLPESKLADKGSKSLWEMTAGTENTYTGATQEYSLTRPETPHNIGDHVVSTEPHTMEVAEICPDETTQQAVSQLANPSDIHNMDTGHLEPKQEENGQAHKDDLNTGQSSQPQVLSGQQTTTAEAPELIGGNGGQRQISDRSPDDFGRHSQPQTGRGKSLVKSVSHSDPYEYRMSQSQRDRQSFQEVLQRGDTKRQLAKRAKSTGGDIASNPGPSGSMDPPTQLLPGEPSQKIIKRSQVTKRTMILRVIVDIIENGEVVKSTTTEENYGVQKEDSVLMVDACTMTNPHREESDLHISPSRTTSTVTSGDLGDVSSMSKSNSSGVSLEQQISLERSLSARSVGALPNKSSRSHDGNASKQCDRRNKFATAVQTPTGGRTSRRSKNSVGKSVDNSANSSRDIPRTESPADLLQSKRSNATTSGLPRDAASKLSHEFSLMNSPDLGQIHVSLVDRVSSTEPSFNKSHNSSLNKTTSPTNNKMSESLFTSPEMDPVDTLAAMDSRVTVAQSSSPAHLSSEANAGSKAYTSLRNKKSNPVGLKLSCISEVGSMAERQAEADSSSDNILPKKRGRKRKAGSDLSGEQAKSVKRLPRNAKHLSTEKTSNMEVPQEESISPSIPYMGGELIKTPQTKDNPSPWDNENRVLAKWSTDKFFYPGLIMSEDNDRCHVMFDDNTDCQCKKGDVVKCSKLAEGQSVMAGPEGLYEPGIIVGHYEDGEDVGYVVEIDNSETQRFPICDVILTADQAADIINVSLAFTAPVGTANISLDNLMDSSRRSGKRPKLCEVTPISTSTPTPKDKRKGPKRKELSSSSGPLLSLQGPKTRSPRISRTVAASLQFDRRGPIPETNIFKGHSFLLTHVIKTEEERIREKKLLGHSSDTSTDDSISESTMSPISEDTRVPFDKDHLRAQIIAGGGVILDKFPQTKAAIPKKCFLISDTYQRTVKYLHCLAANVSCVSQSWIIDSCQLKRRQNYKDYILPAGVSLERHEIVEWHNRGSPLVGTKVHMSSSSPEFCSNWRSVLDTSGCCFVEKLKSGADVPDLIVSDPSCSQAVVKRAKSMGVPIVSTEWIIQSLVTGQTVDYYGHEKYKHDFVEK